MTPVHRSETRVRYQETDRMGIIHHSAYIIYFEVGRTEFMRDAGISYRALEDEGILLAVTNVEVNYRNRGAYDDAIVIETWIQDVRPIRITFGYRVLRPSDNKILADGKTRLACVTKDFKPQRLPDRVHNIAKNLALQTNPESRAKT